jgi:phage terminase large subunit-like protein
MGLRGPGARRLKEAREALPARKRRPPWEKPALSRAERVIAFLQSLPVTKGICAGKRMKLLPDQLEFVRKVYGDLRSDGRRKISLAVKSAPKGSGKTGLTAGLALCHLLGPESEERGEIYSAAVDRGQAAIIFNEMVAIIMKVPAFAVRTNVQAFHKRITDFETGSVYEALSADAKKAHGLAPSLWIFDELAQVEDRTLLDNLTEGMGKRREALGIVISTQARDDNHPLSQLIDSGLRGDDPSTYVHLLAAPQDANPFDESMLRSVNPAWGKYLDLDDLKRSMERARLMPAFEPAYRNLRLNQRIDARAEDRIVTVQTWRLGNAPVSREALAGRRCYGALDLSGKHDLTALVLVFPSDDPEPSYQILPVFWTPEGQLGARRPVEQEKFRLWIGAGHLISVPGPTIRFGFVAAELARLSQEFDIRAVAYDRWRIDDLRQDLSDVGCDVPLEPWGQGFKDMGPAIEHFAELALTARLQHGGHPVLTAAVSNAITVSDPAGNLKIDKDKSNGRGPVRIDGAVAFAMALGLAKRFVDEPKVDVSEFLSRAVII